MVLEQAVLPALQGGKIYVRDLMGYPPMDRRSFIKNSLVTAAAIGCGAALGPLSGSSSARGQPLRPPGARREAEFLSRCIRCMRCVDACPNQAIIPLDKTFGLRTQSTPAIKARRQACMLCNKIDGDYLKCTEACPTGALELVRKDPDDIQTKVSMGVAEVDTALCYSYNNWSCGACYWACPFAGRAMTLGLWERPEIHPEACIGCGLCERSCIRYPQAVRVKPGAKSEGAGSA
jgi:ferredoxin-type protein NapG